MFVEPERGLPRPELLNLLHLPIQKRFAFLRIEPGALPHCYVVRWDVAEPRIAVGRLAQPSVLAIASSAAAATVRYSRTILAGVVVVPSGNHASVTGERTLTARGRR